MIPININTNQVHASTGKHKDDEIEVFYSQVEEALQCKKLGEIVIVMGDMNAKVGSEESKPITGKLGIGEQNERDTRLFEFCKRYDLIIGNTFFHHYPRKLYA